MRFPGRFTLALLLAGFAVPALDAAARAADAPPMPVPGPVAMPAQDQAAIRDVIRHQLDAFRHDDGAAAFAFAAPSIQSQFGDAATFMDMVRRGYQPVYRPGNVVFGALLAQGGKVVQKLEITGQDGSDHEALYFMEHEHDGAWRISGCVLTDGGSVGA